MVLAVVVAIVLTPALCATMLKPIGGDHVHSQHGFFGWFNRWFDSATLRYQSGVSYVIRRAGRFMIIYLVLIGGLVFMFKTLPTGFLPDEDQGMLFAQIQLPTGATQEETTKVLERVERYFLEEEKESIDSLMGVLGFSFAGNGQNMAMAFVRLKDWSERQDPSLKVDAVSKRAMAAFSKIRNAQVFAFAPPAIMELGNATGFDFQLQDKSGLGHEALLQARNQLLGMAAQNKNLVAVRPNGQEDQPQLRVDIDREKAGALSLSLADINAALSTVWGSSYADDFLDKGRVKKVYVQGDAPFRMVPEDMEKWFFRNSKGEMVPFSSFASAHWEYAPARLERYNGVPSVEILGQPAPVRPCWKWRSSPASCLRASATNGPGCPIRNAFPDHRHRLCSPCPSLWCSCASRPCMKAGPCRLRLSSWFPSVCSARSARRTCGCFPTTCTSRWACSPPLVCRRRTPF